MKRIVLLSMVVVTVVSARAQLLTPESFGGALWGTVIGGLAGGNCHNGGFSGNDAAIGAGVGLAVGTIAGQLRQQNQSASQPYYYASAPPAQPYAYYAPNAYTAPGYYYQPAPQPAPAPERPNYAVGGTLLGAASGALIGSGIDHQTWQGAAIGAGAGLVLGGLAEYSAKKHEQKMAVAAQPAPPPQPQAQQSPPAYPLQGQITSRPVPSSTYYWTQPPPQIPDAPRVPDPPRF